MTIETLIFYNYRNYLCTSNSHNELIESGYNDCFTIIYLQNNIGNVRHVLIVRHVCRYQNYSYNINIFSIFHHMADPGEQKYFLAYPYPKNFNSFLKLIDHHLENPMTDIIYIGYEENSDTYRNYSKK